MRRPQATYGFCSVSSINNKIPVLSHVGHFSDAHQPRAALIVGGADLEHFGHGGRFHWTALAEDMREEAGPGFKPGVCDRPGPVHFAACGQGARRGAGLGRKRGAVRGRKVGHMHLRYQALGEGVTVCQAFCQARVLQACVCSLPRSQSRSNWTHILIQPRLGCVTLSQAPSLSGPSLLPFDSDGNGGAGRG